HGDAAPLQAQVHVEKRLLADVAAAEPVVQPACLYDAVAVHGAPQNRSAGSAAARRRVAMAPDKPENTTVPRKTVTAIEGVIARGRVVILPMTVRIAVPTIRPGTKPITPKTSASSKTTPRKKRGPYPIALKVAYSRRWSATSVEST